jgi:hypothetical protein
MPAATTAGPKPICPFECANHKNPNDNLAKYQRRAAYNRDIGALLSLEAELLHASREAEASSPVGQRRGTLKIGRIALSRRPKSPQSRPTLRRSLAPKSSDAPTPDSGRESGALEERCLGSC